MKCPLCEEPLASDAVIQISPAGWLPGTPPYLWYWFDVTSPDGCRFYATEEMLTRRGLTPPPPPSKESSNA